MVLGPEGEVLLSVGGKEAEKGSKRNEEKSELIRATTAWSLELSFRQREGKVGRTDKES